jgi:hypothetical protein
MTRGLPPALLFANNVGHVQPTEVATRIIKFLDDNNAKYHFMVAYDPEDIRRSVKGLPGEIFS